MSGMADEKEEILTENFNEDIFFVTERVRWFEAGRDTATELPDMYLRGPGYGA